MSLSPDLGLVPTDALIEELKGRAEAGVVILELRREHRGGGEDIRQFDWWGGLAVAIGLCEMMKHKGVNHPQALDDEDEGPEV